MPKIYSSAFLPGVMSDYGGGLVPEGSLKCDGLGTYAKVGIYRDLWLALSDGGVSNPWDTADGQAAPAVGFFRVPKCTRKITVGSGGAATSGPGITVGSSGGAETTEQHGHSTPALSHTVNNGGVATSSHGHDAGNLYTKWYFENGQDNTWARQIAIPGIFGTWTSTHNIDTDQVFDDVVAGFGHGVEVGGTTASPNSTATVTVDGHGAGVTGNFGAGLTQGNWAPTVVVTKIIRY